MRARFGSFNTFNLVLPGVRFHQTMEYSPEDYAMKVNWMANQLLQMDADLVGFQEVFHQKALEEVLKKSGIYEGAKVLLPFENGVDPRVALVSRYPVISSEGIVKFPKEVRLSIEGVEIPIQEFKRPVLKAIVRLPNGKNMVVFVAHFKSKRPHIEDESKRFDFTEIARGEVHSLIHRSLESVALRALVLQEIENTRTPVVVMGDLNDSTSSVTTQILMGSAPKSHYPLKVKLRIWDTLLYSTTRLLVRKGFQDIYYTHLHDGSSECLDHVLVSEEFVEDNPKHIGSLEYVKILNDHLLDGNLTGEGMPCWQSDHGQVVASFRLEENPLPSKPL